MIDTGSKKYVVNCCFIQALTCFSPRKFMNRLLFYFSRQRILKPSTVTHILLCQIHPPSILGISLLNSILIPGSHPIFVLKLDNLKESFTPVTTVMKSALFWDLMLRRLVVRYRRFGTTCLSHFKGKNKMRQISCPETSLQHYQYTLRKPHKSTDLVYTNGNLNYAHKYDLSGSLPDLQA